MGLTLASFHFWGNIPVSILGLHIFVIDPIVAGAVVASAPYMSLATAAVTVGFLEKKVVTIETKSTVYTSLTSALLLTCV